MALNDICILICVNRAPCIPVTQETLTSKSTTHLMNAERSVFKPERSASRLVGPRLLRYSSTLPKIDDAKPDDYAQQENKNANAKKTWTSV